MDTVLFDLDGTLLPMDQEQFIKVYFGELVAKFSKQGYNSKQLIDAVWFGTGAMVKNDGSQLNIDAFWAAFSQAMGRDLLSEIPRFESFYANEFERAKSVVQPEPLANQCVKLLKKKGYTVVLATNPIFPEVATMSRIRWAGLDADDFELITTYDNCHYCKPNPKYFYEVLDRIDKVGSQCLMVGNDTIEDTAAAQAGIEVFLLNRTLETHGEPIPDDYAIGDFAELKSIIDDLPNLNCGW